MVPCLHHCKVYVKRKLRVWRAQKCNFLVSAKTAPTGTGQQTTPCLAAPYLVSNRNFQHFGATYRHGTVLAPTQRLCYKKTTGVESPKVQFPSQCQNCTDRYGSTHYPVSCSAAFDKQQKFSKFRGFLSPWYRACTNAMFILKGSYECGEPKNAISQTV